MSLKQFVQENDGKYVEMGGSAAATNQCVDLANKWLKEVLNQPILLGTNAIDFPSKLMGTFDWIQNTVTNIPKPGDLMIFNIGKYGHISIFVEGDAFSFTSFDQNYPIGSPCHLQTHNYSKVLGWLRLKSSIIEEDMTQEEANILKFLKEQGANEGKVREAFGALGDLPKINKQISDLTASLKDMTTRISFLESENRANNDLIKNWQEQVSSANSTISKLQAEIKFQSDEKNTWKNRYEAKLQETIDKYSIKELLLEIIKRITHGK